VPAVTGILAKQQWEVIFTGHPVDAFSLLSSRVAYVVVFILVDEETARNIVVIVVACYDDDIDVIELRLVYVPFDIKYVNLERLFPSSPLTGTTLRRR